MENQSMKINLEDQLPLQALNIPLEFQVDTVLASFANQPAKKKRRRLVTITLIQKPDAMLQIKIMI
ncbi:hypothetical protein BpHYR1_005069 [Brachionus plicatilis]|uniref:Uncharacterized protein n=1 Tax=Brachionus plicatilis TaxID=10195 RepID=A0A3M7T6N3_BRAPC|nr:hypothetical protein BpHYR1_005069 [Brachionus plicatilis]